MEHLNYNRVQKLRMEAKLPLPSIKYHVLNIRGITR